MMADKRFLDEIPRPKHLPFELPENIDPDVYLLAGDPQFSTRTFLGQHWLWASGVFIFTGASFLRNALNGRPMMSALHRHVLMGVVGGVLGKLGHNRKEQWAAEKDLQYLHYVSLHPEDFIAPKRVLYRDYLTKWTPVR